MKAVFTLASKISPSVIFIDEVFSCWFMSQENISFEINFGLFLEVFAHVKEPISLT